MLMYYLMLAFVVPEKNTRRKKTDEDGCKLTLKFFFVHASSKVKKWDMQINTLWISIQIHYPLTKNICSSLTIFNRAEKRKAQLELHQEKKWKWKSHNTKKGFLPSSIVQKEFFYACPVTISFHDGYTSIFNYILFKWDLDLYLF